MADHTLVDLWGDSSGLKIIVIDLESAVSLLKRKKSHQDTILNKLHPNYIMKK